jgi:PAS domain S-box-containing protein
MKHVDTAPNVEHQLGLWKRLWAWLVQVHPSITDPQARNQAQMFLGMLCFLPVAEVVLFLFYSLWSGAMPLAVAPAPLITFINTLWLFALGRTRYYFVSIYLAVFLNTACIFILILFAGTSEAFQVMPPYLMLGIFVASLFCTSHINVIIIVISVLGIFSLTLVHPVFEMEIAANHIRLIVLSSIMISIFSYMLRRTQREAAEKADALTQSEARYRSLFNASLEPLVIFYDGRIIDMNGEVERLLGYTAEEVHGKPLLKFLDREDWGKVLPQTGTTGEHRYELRFIRKDGSDFYADVRTKPHLHYGQPVRVASVRDITAQRELEAQRLTLAVEADRDAVLQQLLGNLSHDFRTPLSVIKTSLYLLERTLDDPVKHGKQIEVVRLQTQRLQEMLEDFMTLTRLDYARKGDMEGGQFNVDMLIRDVMREHEAAAEKRSLTLRFEALSPLPPVYASEFTLRRILKRIVTNAVNYTLPNGTITLRAELIDDELCISVEDTGVGIPPEDLPYIFDHFYRADKARNTESGGAGLGLTIAHKLAEMIGGSIEVVSVVNEGSTFTVRLPVRVVEPEAERQSLVAQF